MHGRTDGQTDGRTDGRTDGQLAQLDRIQLDQLAQSAKFYFLNSNFNPKKSKFNTKKCKKMFKTH